jgi:hypothetical protein
MVIFLSLVIVALMIRVLGYQAKQTVIIPAKAEVTGHMAVH